MARKRLVLAALGGSGHARLGAQTASHPRRELVSVTEILKFSGGELWTRLGDVHCILA